MGKNVLIYGDSLTWGKVPMQHARYDTATRWPAVLQAELGSSYTVIAEGLRGRMLEGGNPHYPQRDGLQQYGPILASHLPLDVVVIMLGTNDCSAVANKTAEEIAAGLYKYKEVTLQWAENAHVEPPQLVFIAPPRIHEAVANEDPRKRFSGSEAKSKRFSVLYKKAAEECGALFFDASQVATPSREDGLHLDAKNQKKLGQAFARFVVEN